jgi:Reverse transcriptase (RNA-dependent DNA polymerase)
MKLVYIFYYNILDVSKKQDVKLITKFRSISLINVSFKIIIKVLSSRLAPYMDSLISVTQTVYIKGKNIMDNVVMASDEVLHLVRF